MLKNKIGIHIQQTGEQDQELGCNASENLPGPWNHHVSVSKSAKQQHNHFNHSCEQTRVFLLDRIDGVYFLYKPIMTDNLIFCVMTQCSSIDVYQHFEGTWYLHLHVPRRQSQLLLQTA